MKAEKNSKKLFRKLLIINQILRRNEMMVFNNNKLPMLITLLSLLLVSSGYRSQKESEIEGFYSSYPCISLRCSKCLSISIEKDSTFFWSNLSPCETVQITGHWTIVEGKKSDTIILNSCERWVLGKRRTDTLETKKLYKKLNNETWLLKNNRLYYLKQENSAFQDIYLSKNFLK